MKNLNKTVCSIIIFLLISVNLAVMLIHAEGLEYSDDTITETQQEQYVARKEFSLIKQEPEKQPVINFDVNQNEELLLCTKRHGDYAAVYVYTKDGTFEFGLKFRETGSYGAEWENEDVLLYSARSSLAYLVGRDGTVKEVRSLKESSKNSTYMNKVRTKITMNGNTYSMKNKNLVMILSSSFSIITREDGSENVVSVYDASKKQERTAALVVIIGAILVVLWIGGIVAAFVIAYQVHLRKKRMVCAN